MVRVVDRVTRRGCAPRRKRSDLSHLKASDIARELGISRSAAYEIMKEMPRLVRRGIVRVSPEAFKRWRERNTVGPWSSSIDAEKEARGGSSSRVSAVRLATRTERRRSCSSKASNVEQ